MGAPADDDGVLSADSGEQSPPLSGQRTCRKLARARRIASAPESKLSECVIRRAVESTPSECVIARTMMRVGLL